MQSRWQITFKEFIFQQSSKLQVAVVKYWLLVSGDSEIMAGCGWSSVVLDGHMI